jgi:septal ring factor EnvC (AmiA/AmiB activator)
MYILASDNIGQAARRYSYLRTLSGKMNEQARRINESKAELEVKLEEQKQMRERAEQLRQQRKAELSSLRKEEQQSQNLVSQLNREKKKYQNELNSKKKQVDALNREIQRLIANEIKASGGGKGNASSSKKATRKVDTKLAAEFAANQGRLPWPCEGVVVEHFGQHNHPVYTNLVMPFNNGVDISVSKGTKAHAVFNGEVRKVIVMPGYNKCVLVQHGEYFTFYCKLKSVAVKAGDKVKTGTVLGTVDTISGEDQLHFQLWKERTPQNPETWLK